MKILTTISVIILPFMLMISSCQKGIELEQKPAIDDGTLISKVILLDTTQPAPLDSIWYTSFQYDQQKRVITICRLERNGLSLDTILVTHLYYKGNDTLAYRGVTDYHTSGSTEELFKYYDESGKLIKDSLIDNSGMLTIRVQRYAYLTNRLRIDDVVMIPSAGVNDRSTYYFSQQRSSNNNNSNILSQKDTVDYTATGGGFYVRTLTYQYDNHPNPFRMDWHYFPFYQFDEAIPDNSGTNNFTETYGENNDVSGNTDISHRRYSYQYNSAGFPKIAWERDLINNTVDKYIYLYTK